MVIVLEQENVLSWSLVALVRGCGPVPGRTRCSQVDSEDRREWSVVASGQRNTPVEGWPWNGVDRIFVPLDSVRYARDFVPQPLGRSEQSPPARHRESALSIAATSTVERRGSSQSGCSITPASRHLVVPSGSVASEHAVLRRSAVGRIGSRIESKLRRGRRR